jgi:hypothetical protein
LKSGVTFVAIGEVPERNKPVLRDDDNNNNNNNNIIIIIGISTFGEYL